MYIQKTVKKLLFLLGCLVLVLPAVGISSNKIEVCANTMSDSLGIFHAFFRLTIDGNEVETTGYTTTGVVKNRCLGAQGDCKTIESFANALTARRYWEDLCVILGRKGLAIYNLVTNNCSIIASRTLEELRKYDLATWIKNKNPTVEKVATSLSDPILLPAAGNKVATSLSDPILLPAAGNKVATLLSDPMAGIKVAASLSYLSSSSGSSSSSSSCSIM